MDVVRDLKGLLEQLFYVRGGMRIYMRRTMPDVSPYVRLGPALEEQIHMTPGPGKSQSFCLDTLVALSAPLSPASSLIDETLNQRSQPRGVTIQADSLNGASARCDSRNHRGCGGISKLNLCRMNTGVWCSGLRGNVLEYLQYNTCLTRAE